MIIVNNQSQNTKEQVSTLENSIFSGVILVVLVLMFFLGVRNALFVGLSIPLSMCISFIILQIFDFASDQTLNSCPHPSIICSRFVYQMVQMV